MKKTKIKPVRLAGAISTAALFLVGAPLASHAQSFDETTAYITEACEGATWVRLTTDRVQFSNSKLEFWTSEYNFTDMNRNGRDDPSEKSTTRYYYSINLSGIEKAEVRETQYGPWVIIYGERGFAKSRQDYTPGSAFSQYQSPSTINSTPSDLYIVCSRADRVVNAFNHLTTTIEDDPFK